MAKDEQILVRVEPEKKEEWVEVADERGFRGLAGFIRFAVNNEIQGRAPESSTETGGIGDEITDTVGSIDERTRTINHRLGTIEAALQTIQEDMSKSGMAAPDIPSPERIITALPQMSPKENSDEELRDDAATPDMVADEFGLDVGFTRELLSNLDLQTERVQSIEIDDDQRGYFADV